MSSRLFSQSADPVFVASGVGLHMTAKCDECHFNGGARRKRGKVKAGPLKGLFGMICQKCCDKREKVPA